MNIVLAFDSQELTSYAQRGASPPFDIAWEHQGIYYPAKHWNDFGAVIMIWWLRTTVYLSEEAEKDTFRFMDGPYILHALYDRDTKIVQIQPEDMDVTWFVPMYELAQELVNAATIICEELQNLGIGEEERHSREFGVKRVKERVLTAGANDA